MASLLYILLHCSLLTAHWFHFLLTLNEYLVKVLRCSRSSSLEISPDPSTSMLLKSVSASCAHAAIGG